MSDAGLQFQNQRELARLQRRHHDAETALDRAEVRHEAIQGWVFSMRYWVPIALGVVLGGAASREPHNAWVATMGVLWGGLIVGTIFRNVADFLFSSFKPGIEYNAEDFAFTVIGAVFMCIMLSYGWNGAALFGFTMMARGFVFRRWARAVLNNTDYSRLKAQLRAPSAEPRIVE